MTQSAVTTYSVEYYPEGQDSSSVTLTVNAPTTTVMIVGLSKGTRYTVQVCANNAIGSSSLSNLLTARTNIDRNHHTSHSCHSFPLNASTYIYYICLCFET